MRDETTPRPATEEEITIITRQMAELAQLGLWARDQGIPALEIALEKLKTIEWKGGAGGPEWLSKPFAALCNVPYSRTSKNA